MVFPLVRSDSWSAFLAVDPDLFSFRSYTKQQVEFSKMGLNWRRLCSLCWQKFWGAHFSDEGKGKHICLFQVRTVISALLCANAVCVHCFTGQCTADLTFVKLGKHFPCVIKGLLCSWVSYKCQFIFSFYFLDASLHTRLLTEAFDYHWRQ